MTSWMLHVIEDGIDVYKGRWTNRNELQNIVENLKVKNPNLEYYIENVNYVC